jgi:hypothetical protein
MGSTSAAEDLIQTYPVFVTGIATCEKQASGVTAADPPAMVFRPRAGLSAAPSAVAKPPSLPADGGEESK